LKQIEIRGGSNRRHNTKIASLQSSPRSFSTSKSAILGVGALGDDDRRGITGIGLMYKPSRDITDVPRDR
jgi:hypothetical protein